MDETVDWDHLDGCRRFGREDCDKIKVKEWDSGKLFAAKLCLQARKVFWIFVVVQFIVCTLWTAWLIGKKDSKVTRNFTFLACKASYYFLTFARPLIALVVLGNYLPGSNNFGYMS